MIESYGTVHDREIIETARTSGVRNATNTQNQATPLDDRVLVICPHCNAVLKVRRIHAGSGVRCKRCAQKFLLPTTIGGPANPLYDGLIADATNRSNQIVQSDQTGTARDRLMAQLAQFIASNDERESAHHLLRNEHTNLLSEKETILASLEVTSSELTAIRTELGTIGAGDSPSLAAAVEGLVIEIRSLRDQNKKFLDDITEAKCSIGRLEVKVAELVPLQEERGTLLESIKARELSFSSICAERDALKDNLCEGNAALVEKDGEIARLTQQLAESDSRAGTAREACMEARQQLDRSQDDVRDLRAEVVRLIDERTKGLATIEQLQACSAERERVIEIQLGKLNSELESSRAAFSSSDQARQQQAARLDSELSSLKDEHESLLDKSQSEGTLLAALRARNDELVAAHERLTAAHSDQLASAEVERNKIASELRDLRAEYEETIQMAEQWISAALEVPTVPVASAEELDAAEVSTDALTHNNFAKSDYLSRIMAETLEIGDVRFGSPGGPSDSTVPATEPPSDLDDLMLADVRSAREFLPISQKLEAVRMDPALAGHGPAESERDYNDIAELVLKSGIDLRSVRRN
jgi:chromosome segregation ATPase